MQYFCPFIPLLHGPCVCVKAHSARLEPTTGLGFPGSGFWRHIYKPHAAASLSASPPFFIPSLAPPPPQQQQESARHSRWVGPATLHTVASPRVFPPGSDISFFRSRSPDQGARAAWEEQDGSAGAAQGAQGGALSPTRGQGHRRRPQQALQDVRA